MCKEGGMSNDGELREGFGGPMLPNPVCFLLNAQCSIISTDVGGVLGTIKLLNVSRDQWML